MKFEERRPPRQFEVGATLLADCGTIRLDPDEQVTFTTDGGAAYDVARRVWGFYATPSTNARLPEHGLRAALARNDAGRTYVLLVEDGCEDDFAGYCSSEGLRVVAWLDDDAALARLDS